MYKALFGSVNKNAVEIGRAIIGLNTYFSAFSPAYKTGSATFATVLSTGVIPAFSSARPVAAWAPSAACAAKSGRPLNACVAPKPAPDCATLPRIAPTVPLTVPRKVSHNEGITSPHFQD